MPNYVRNRMTIVADERHVSEVLAFIKGDKSYFDFNRVIPMPSELNIESSITSDRELNEKYDANLKKYGYRDWYYWRRDMWGTKWNAMDVHMEDDAIVFDTAWASPAPVFKALSERFVNIQFEIAYADEDIAYNCGELTYKGGTCIDSYYPDGGSTEAYDLYFSVWGEDERSNYKFTRGCYIPKED